MAGLTPWKAPSPTRASHGQVIRRSRKTEGVGRGVSALQADLMRQVVVRPLDEEVAGQLDAAARLRVHPHHPALDAVRVELRVDRSVERVGEVDPLAVAAHLDHLRAAVEGTIVARPGRARDDAADPELAGELGR